MAQTREAGEPRGTLKRGSMGGDVLLGVSHEPMIARQTVGVRLMPRRISLRFPLSLKQVSRAPSPVEPVPGTTEQCREPRDAAICLPNRINTHTSPRAKQPDHHTTQMHSNQSANDPKTHTHTCTHTNGSRNVR